jgi:LacI family transcriptional regulator
MKRHQITIKDIAQKLNVSPSTVSRALKDHPDINPKTRKAVKEIAQKYNYVPNRIAQSLLQNKSYIIGVIIPEIIHHFFSSVISGIENIAHENGFNVMLCQSKESYNIELKNVETLLSSHIDGMLISITKETKDFTHIEHLQEMGIPIAFFDRIAEEIECDRIIVDDFGGGYKATEHLIQQGCQRIAHLYSPLDLLIGRNRYNGFIKAMEDNNMPIYNEYLIFCDSYEKAKIEAKTLIDLPNSPDGIFCGNDETAIGAMKTIKSHGFKIPEDIAVVGFTNSYISTISDPELSTVDQKGYQLGQKAASTIISRIAEQESVPKKTSTQILDTELIVRESSKKLK